MSDTAIAKDPTAEWLRKYARRASLRDESRNDVLDLLEAARAIEHYKAWYARKCDECAELYKRLGQKPR